MTVDPVDLERHLEQLPRLVDDPGYLVFADWLQAQGHPWGELIVIHHRATIAATASEREELELAAMYLLDQHGAAILGDLPRDVADLTWHLGFVRRARLHTAAIAGDVLAATRALLAAPAARMIETLVLDPRPERFDTTQEWGSSTVNIVDPWPDWDDVGPLIHERIAHLGFGAWPASAASAYVRMPSFDMISRWMRTTLRKLEVTGSSRRQARDRFELLELVELDVRYAHAVADDLVALATSKLPVLERLHVGLGGAAHCILDDVYPPADRDEENEDQERYPPHYSADDLDSLEVHGVRTAISGNELRRFLDALPPDVTDFGLPSSALDAQLLGTLVAHPRIAGLRRLDLAGCTITDQTVPILIEAAPVLSRIGAIDLSRNQLTSRFTSRLATALPNATLGEQGRAEPDFFMRYVGTME